MVCTAPYFFLFHSSDLISLSFFLALQSKDLNIIKVIMKTDQKSLKVPHAYGFLLSIMVLTSLLVLSMAEEELDEGMLQQKMAENGMDPQTSQVFKPPKMTDEERGSRHMPKYLRCAGCVAIAHQVCLFFLCVHHLFLL